VRVQDRNTDECVDIGNDGGNGMLIGSGVLSI